MTFLDEIRLRDLDDSELIEATCIKCGHVWNQSPIQLLLKVDHRDVSLNEVASDLACTRYKCRHVGVRITLIRNEDTYGFVGGMP